VTLTSFDVNYPKSLMNLILRLRIWHYLKITTLIVFSVPKNIKLHGFSEKIRHKIFCQISISPGCTGTLGRWALIECTDVHSVHIC